MGTGYERKAEGLGGDEGDLEGALKETVALKRRLQKCDGVANG
jgi:hypothetical protein